MNKQELVTAVAEKANATKKQTEEILNALTKVIIEATASGDKVQIMGFGSFEQMLRKERVARNPRSGEQMTIPETKIAKFRPGKEFKEKVAQIIHN